MGLFFVFSLFEIEPAVHMDQLVQSIKERGIITPVTLRPKEDGRYEIVSGHRRKKACELAGLDTVKAEVREMSRDEAIILMVESNLQRSTILPSEKAFSYKMRLEAMNRQGQRSDLTCGPVDHKLDGVKSRDKVRLNDEETIGITLDAYIPELKLAVAVIGNGTKAEEEAVLVTQHLCKVRGLLFDTVSFKDSAEGVCRGVKKAFQGAHIYITSDNDDDVRTARRQFFRWKKC